MAEETKKAPPSELSLWLADALPGWLLPVIGLVLFGTVAILYFLGIVSDRVVGLILTGMFGVALAVIALRAAFHTLDTSVRAASIALVLLFSVAAFYPARMVLHPGTPLVTATLSESQKTLTLPSSGTYRIFVSAALKPGGEARVSYHLKIDGEAVDGTLERVYSYQRAGRRGSVRVAEDRNVSFHDLTLSGEKPQITLESVTGDLASAGLTVGAVPLLPPAVIWGVIALVLLLAMWLEGKAAGQGAFTMTALSAVIFGLLIKTGDPASALGPVMGSALLGAGGGAIGGSILKSLGRKLFGPKAPAEDAPPKRKAA